MQNNMTLFGRFYRFQPGLIKLTFILLFAFIAGPARADSKQCPDKNKPLPIGVAIDFCRVAHLTPVILHRASEEGFGSGALMAQSGNNRHYQTFFKRFFVLTNDPKDSSKVVIERSFIVKDLKNWVSIFSKKGRDIVELRAKKVNAKGGYVTVRFHTNVLSGSHKDYEMKINFNAANEPEIFIKNKVFNALEITPSRLFGKPVGVGILRFEYFGTEALTLELI